MTDALRFAAIGDSFTEGIGDELDDGTIRGWADQTAYVIAASRPVEYVNLAIRGRLLAPIATTQLDQVLRLKPDILTFNGGGNDIMRPGVRVDQLTVLTERAILKCREADVRLVVLAGANPSRHMPFGAKINAAGAALTEAIRKLTSAYGVEFVDNYSDVELTRSVYWSADRLHLNADGHRRVAARLLTSLGYEPPAGWFDPLASPDPSRTGRDQVDYYRRHVAPWVWRHLRGRSSGDGVLPKHASWTPLAVEG